jgi:hypothetical protein
VDSPRNPQSISVNPQETTIVEEGIVIVVEYAHKRGQTSFVKTLKATVMVTYITEIDGG